MSNIEMVEDPEDPRLTDYREIRDAERRRRSGTFIAEGRQVVRRLLDVGRYRARSALVTPPALDARGTVLGDARVPPYLVRQDIVNAIVGIEFHHGCLAVGERGAEQTPEAVLDEAGGASVVLLEGLGDASNVGAIFRNALAFGAGAALLSPGTADPLYRKAIRVSAGAAVVLPFARLDDWPHRASARALEAGRGRAVRVPRDPAQPGPRDRAGSRRPHPPADHGRPGPAWAERAARRLALAAAPAPSARAAVRARALARDRC